MQKHLLRSLITLLLLVPGFGTLAQDSPLTPWIGEWKGSLEIFNTRGLAQTVAMELNVKQLSDSSWTWQLVYGAGEARQPRNYELLTTDEPGHYVIDEKNSIELYLSLVHNGFFSFFQVGKSKLLISYELVNDEIHFRTHSANTDTKYQTGGEENIPLVLSWKTGAYQKAVLKKN